MSEFRALRWVPLVVAALMVGVAGCAQKPTQTATAGAATPGSPQDFAVNVGDRVYFTVDSSEINATSSGVLDRQAQWLNQYSRYGILIEGHADERGTREYNIALSARRAEATKNYLQSRGVASGRLRTIAYGKERPVAVCDDESCFTQNRRAVTVLSGG